MGSVAGDAIRSADRLRVLVAESDHHLRSVLSWVLDDDGRFLVVAQAANASEVATCAEPFDLAVVDLVLTGSTRLETVSGLRLRAPAPVVVVVSEVDSQYLRQAVLAEGAAALLVKPGDLDDLSERLFQLAEKCIHNPLVRIS